MINHYLNNNISDLDAVVTSDEFQSSAPNAKLPQLMYGDTLYYMDGKLPLKLNISENEYSGTLFFVPTLSQIPELNNQINYSFGDGAPFVKYDNRIIVLIENRWSTFITKEDLLSKQY
jgi:hypothetical protein